MEKFKVYLIPNLLGSEATVNGSIPAENRAIIATIRYFAVENLKEARRFLVKMGLKEIIDQSEFFLLDKRSTAEELLPILEVLKKGDVGIISDAGCPGIADPGALLVNEAHRLHIPVKPLIGPSSILLALIASGLNGQGFRFSGYLDREPSKRAQEIKQLEAQMKQAGETQIFMETPYRNDALLVDLTQHLSPHVKLCIACNISLPNELIQTKQVGEWKKRPLPQLKKQPCVFLIGR